MLNIIKRFLAWIGLDWWNDVSASPVVISIPDIVNTITHKKHGYDVVRWRGPRKRRRKKIIRADNS